MSRSVVRVHAGPHLRPEAGLRCAKHSVIEMKTRAVPDEAIAMASWGAGEVGGLAQLARAPALQAGGQRFESVILHIYAKALVCGHGGERLGGVKGSDKRV